MTVQNQTIRQSYTGDGSSTVFPIKFAFFQDSDILVLVGGGIVTTGFSISGGMDTTGAPNAGSLTFGSPPAIGVNIQIVLNDPLTQLVALVDGQQYLSAILNQIFDRAIQVSQRLQDQLIRSLRAPDGDVSPSMLLPPASQRANTFQAYDASGNSALLTVVPTGTPISQAIVGQVLYPQTTAELSVAVIPSNYAYPQGNVKRYGAKGDGVTDDSAAINAAFLVCNQAGGYIANPPDFLKAAPSNVYFPPGDYVYAGSGISLSVCMCLIVGAGKNVTRVIIQQNIYLVSAQTAMFAGITGIHTYGGKGVFVCTSAVVNTLSQFVFEDNVFFNYTECAIGSLLSDGPHFKIRRNQFHGALTAGGERQSFGIVFAGRTDGVEIENNEFQENKAHIKLVANATTAGSDAINIRENIFERWTTSPGSIASYDIWIVPSPSAPTTTGGIGEASVIEGNRFGNENLLTTDYHILVSDENTGSGTSSLNFPPTLTGSSRYAGGFQIIHNAIFGTGASSRAFIYSYTPNWWGNDVRGNQTYGTPISMQDFYPAAMTDTNTAQNATGRIDQMHLGLPSFLMTNPSTYFMGPVDDPLVAFASYQNVPAFWRSGFDPSYTELTTQAVASFTLNSATVSNITDSVGGNEAVEITATGAFGGISTAISTPTTGKLGFVSFDFEIGASLAVPSIQVALTDVSGINNAVLLRQIAPLAAGWRRITIPFAINAGITTINNLSFSAVGYSAGVATKFRIGRVRCYHAFEPAHPGVRTLDSGLISWTPGAIGNGAQASTTVTVTGAQYTGYGGPDLTMVGYGAALAGCVISAQVTATNTVTITITNNTGSSQTPTATTNMRVRVFKAI